MSKDKAALEGALNALLGCADAIINVAERNAQDHIGRMRRIEATLKRRGVKTETCARLRGHWHAEDQWLQAELGRTRAAREMVSGIRQVYDIRLLNVTERMLGSETGIYFDDLAPSQKRKLTIERKAEASR